MGQIKQLKGKTLFKHETEQDWLQSNYVPSLGEKVLYDPDFYYSFTRVKYGDGIHTVKELPFSVEQVDWLEENSTTTRYVKHKPTYSYIVDEDGVLCLETFTAGIKLISFDDKILSASNGIHITIKEE